MDHFQQQLFAYIQAVLPMERHICEQIVQSFSFKEVSKNEFYLTEGHVSNEYCFLLEGFMRSYTHDVDGNEVTTGFFASQQVVIDIASFFKRIPAQENIQTLSPCKVLYVNFEQIQFLFHSIPQFREFGRTVLVNFNVQLRQRMLSMIQQTAEQRYASLLKNNGTIFQNAPLKYIASYLGLTDTSLSRIRKEFSKLGS